MTFCSNRKSRSCQYSFHKWNSWQNLVLSYSEQNLWFQGFRLIHANSCYSGHTFSMLWFTKMLWSCKLCHEWIDSRFVCNTKCDTLCIAFVRSKPSDCLLFYIMILYLLCLLSTSDTVISFRRNKVLSYFIFTTGPCKHSLLGSR